MNEDVEAQRIGKAYAAQHITVEDIAVTAQGKVKQAKAKATKSPEPLSIKEETIMNGVMAEKKAAKAEFVPAHSAADRLAAAIKERNEHGWMFCGNDMELERGLNHSADKERRLNIATRNAMTPPAPQPKKKRRTPTQMSEDRLADLQKKLDAATERRDATNNHISKLTQERPYADAERQVVIKGALEILRGEQSMLSSKVSNMKDDVRMEAERLRKLRGEPEKQLTELQKAEAAWRETQKISRVR